jgi:hypothetical protein
MSKPKVARPERKASPAAPPPAPVSDPPGLSEDQCETVRLKLERAGAACWLLRDLSAGVLTGLRDSADRTERDIAIWLAGIALDSLHGDLSEASAVFRKARQVRRAGKAVA